MKFVESGYANLQMSEQKVRDLMGQYPQIRGIMATSAVTAMGLVDELKDTDIKIVAVDEQEDSLKAVENGQILALAAQSGYAERKASEKEVLSECRDTDTGQCKGVQKKR